MAHKLVGFADSSNSINIQYITEQLSAIANEIEGLATEISDENDSRLQRHSRTPKRESRNRPVSAALNRSAQSVGLWQSPKVIR